MVSLTVTSCLWFVSIVVGQVTVILVHWELPFAARVVLRGVALRRAPRVLFLLLPFPSSSFALGSSLPPSNPPTTSPTPSSSGVTFHSLLENELHVEIIPTSDNAMLKIPTLMFECSKSPSSPVHGPTTKCVAPRCNAVTR